MFCIKFEQNFHYICKKALRDRRIPFEIVAPAEPFYSDSNRVRLEKAQQQVKDGIMVSEKAEEN